MLSKISSAFGRFLTRRALALASILLSIQMAVIALDFFSEIWILDEVLGFLIVLTLTWIIKLLRNRIDAQDEQLEHFKKLNSSYY